jgi:methionyl aminopeptidase
MSIETPEELAGLRASGRVVAEALRAMRRAVRPGITTGELDSIAARVFRRAGARSAPGLTYGFPGATCISVNDETVHGIPGPRRLREGDLVSLDVAAELDGFYADACVTVGVGRARPTVCEELMGHEIGRRLHEAPDVPNVYDAALTDRLTDGLVLTIEPIVSAGSGAVHQSRDGWTMCTA